MPRILSVEEIQTQPPAEFLLGIVGQELKAIDLEGKTEEEASIDFAEWFGGKLPYQFVGCYKQKKPRKTADSSQPLNKATDSESDPNSPL